MLFRINDCSIDVGAYELRRNGTLIPVEPQVFDLLVLLLRHRDRVVSKDEIIEQVWKGRIVSDAALSSRIKTVRQAIGDDGASQSCIRTIRGRGFRVVAEVQESICAKATVADAAGAALSVIDGDDRPGRVEPPFAMPPVMRAHSWILGRKRAAALGIIVGVIVLGVAGAWSSLRPEPVPIAAAALGMPSGPGIAVLPFSDLSNDGTLDFFRDAITEEIITQLTRFSELRVAGRGLTSDYADRDIDAQELGQRLGAEFLVQGSLRRAGDLVRVTAQLVKAADGKLLWAETYERQLTPADIFAVQEDVAGKVVASVGSMSAGVIASEARGQARRKPPRDLSAYECTIRASEIMTSGFSAATHLATRTCLEAAVASEPDNASAWAILAWTHAFEYSQGYNHVPGSDPLERALAAARRAVELAPANPMARFAMARVAYLMRDLDLFYSEAASALSLNPHEPFLLGNIGNWLAFSGRWEEGVALIDKAIALNPKVYPTWWHAALGKDHYRKGEYQDALTEFKKINLPNWYWNQIELAYTYAQLGDLENARKATTKLYDLYPGFDLAAAVMEHRKFSFEKSYIDLAVDGLRKAGVPARTTLARKP